MALSNIGPQDEIGPLSPKMTVGLKVKAIKLGPKITLGPKMTLGPR